MTISREELDDLHFRPTHEWFFNGTTIKSRTVPNHHPNANLQKPMVYMWLTPLDGNHERFRLLYVGKAGAGITRRNIQHEGGFQNSKTGQKNLELIRQVLTTNAPVLIYSRISERRSILGHEISIYSAEEEALCERFTPEWNRAQFAGGEKERKTADVTPNNSENPKNMAPEPRNLSNFDFSRLARSDEIYSFVESIDQEVKDQFAKLLDWAFCIQRMHHLEQKIVLKYTNQPPGYNGIPMLVFAEFGRAGNAMAGSWMVRIPLRSDDQYPLTVVLPQRLKSAKVRQDAIVDGKHPNYRPLDLEDFLSNTSDYIQLPGL